MTHEWIYFAILLLAPTLAVLSSHLLTKQRLTEIHVLVNARLEATLTEIEVLKQKVELLKLTLSVEKEKNGK